MKKVQQRAKSETTSKLNQYTVWKKTEFQCHFPCCFAISVYVVPKTLVHFPADSSDLEQQGKVLELLGISL